MPRDAYKPPFGLDPHVAIRDPNSLPVILRRGMFRIIQQRVGKSDPNYDDFVASFNIAAWSLTTAGRTRNKKAGAKKTNRGQARLVMGTTKLTGKFKKVELEKARLPDTPEKMQAIERWANQIKSEDEDRATMTWQEWDKRDRRSPA